MRKYNQHITGTAGKLKHTKMGRLQWYTIYISWKLA